MSVERLSNIEPVEVRSEGKGMVAHGYAARFGKLSQNLGGFKEQIAAGAFTKTLQEQDIRSLFNHDEGLVLGRNRSGTLRLEEDSDGLAYEIDLPETTVGRDVAALLERGDVSGSSFGFRMIDEEWGETEDGFPLRTLKQVALRDAGPVTFPAYTDATSALRSLAEKRSMPVSELVAAAAAGALRAVIFPSTGGDQQGTGDDDSRGTPTVVRERLTWLYT